MLCARFQTNSARVARLGATRIETTFRVMIQASLSGILASIILALSRAVGETMAVTLAVGTVAVYTSNMFLPAQTMTAYIAQRVGGDLPFGEIGYMTIFAVGLYLRHHALLEPARQQGVVRIPEAY